MTTTYKSWIPNTWSYNSNYDGYNISDLDNLLSENKAKYRSSATFPGYVSRKKECEIFDYKGYYGSGFVVAYPNYKGTIYCNISYFIIQGTEK